jgi:hypothetical protein
MAVLILIVLSLAIVHFVYEGMILPTIRLHFRYRLFALRDRLRHLKTKEDNKLDADSYRYLQEALNVMIAFLYRFDLRAAFEANSWFRKHPDLQKKAEARITALNNCNNLEFKKIMRDSFVISCWVLSLNSAGFLCLLSVPITIFVIANGLRRVWALIKSRAMNVFYIPERESDALNNLCM